MKTRIKAILFDLDGTLLDTAPDLYRAISTALSVFGYPAYPFESFRQTIASGSVNMVRHAFNISPNHPRFDEFKEYALNEYEKINGQSSLLFEGIETLLDTIETQHIPWGIVTNKSSRFTFPILDKLNLTQRASCIITADMQNNRKPHPEPLLNACQQLHCDPQSTWYVGDYKSDIIAAKAAHMPSIAVTYGYFENNENPFDWHADMTVHHPQDIQTWLVKQTMEDIPT